MYHPSIGLIAIPGMMTGAILGGAEVAQAARMQMVRNNILYPLGVTRISHSMLLIFTGHHVPHHSMHDIMRLLYDVLHPHDPRRRATLYPSGPD